MDERGTRVFIGGKWGDGDASPAADAQAQRQRQQRRARPPAPPRVLFPASASLSRRRSDDAAPRSRACPPVSAGPPVATSAAGRAPWRKRRRNVNSMARCGPRAGCVRSGKAGSREPAQGWVPMGRMVPFGALGFLSRTRSHGRVVCRLFRPGRARAGGRGGVGCVWIVTGGK